MPCARTNPLVRTVVPSFAPARSTSGRGGDPPADWARPHAAGRGDFTRLAFRRQPATNACRGTFKAANALAAFVEANSGKRSARETGCEKLTKFHRRPACIGTMISFQAHSGILAWRLPCDVPGIIFESPEVSRPLAGCTGKAGWARTRLLPGIAPGSARLWGGARMPLVSAWWMLLALLAGACIGLVAVGLLRSGRASLHWDHDAEPLSGMAPAEGDGATSNVVSISREARSARHRLLAPHRLRLVSGRPADFPGHRSPLAIHRLHLSGGRKR